ncbi:uncharacterized protein BX663DRAFT_505520 [Cokeromyces recurvatus]|uniref:uncharacterized protein n=1 Tax=Cokeromyces recurvatus TaxID=90255 RepID=UPI00221F6DF0|nr:uncharacterized protein BX663DRAFT_505520 [Cokeromyces recurvatus]KAI7903872.1 hypothetical protein BX663DRAFT_505520 [Cokeromyces recurvatus]
MKASNTSELLTKYQAQNSEIIKYNIRLNEKINHLEKIISRLQQENIQLRMSKVSTKKAKVNSKPNKKERKQKMSSLVSFEQNETYVRKTRQHKPINYTLPNTKCKLRKGDPFTFGNDKKM